MTASLLLMWREGVTAALADEGEFVVTGPTGRVSLRNVPPALLNALNRIGSQCEEEQHLTERVEREGSGLLAQWYYYIELLSRRGLLCLCAHANGVRLASLVPISSSFKPSSAVALADRRYVLSRFAYLRRERNQTVLESPLAHARIILDDCRVAGIIGALATPSTVNPSMLLLRDFSIDAMTGVCTLLLRAGMMGEADPEGNCIEESGPALQTWAFHDLLFHARSRSGRFDAPYGGTYRFAGRLEPPPAVKPPRAGKTVELYRPDLERVEGDDPPLAWVQEHRCSIREYAINRPITDRQLGEFLYRVARVKGSQKAEVAGPAGSVCLDITARPYPSGGSLYEIEFYVAVRNCANLDEGLYHYDPLRHSITQLSGRTTDVNKLLRDAAQSATIPEEHLQVLFILAARVPRLAWKYESIAYALILKHVGVILQNMYLTATAMKLAPCAIGGGDADLFARAAGAEYCAETSVGEFLLGSLKDELPAVGRPDQAPDSAW